MGGCHRHCPRGRLRPGTGRCRSRLSARRRAAVRVLPARPVLCVALRVLRLQHLHRQGARWRWVAGVVRRDRGRRGPAWPGGSWGTWTGRWTRCSSAEVRRRCSRRRISARMLAAVRDEFGLAPDAEVTTEANPESVDPAYLAAIGSRVHPGVASGCRVRRRTCCRSSIASTRRAGRWQAVKEATAAGFEHVNLDLIYGTPGESIDDWRTSLESALSAAARPRQRVRVDRRGRHPVGPSGPAWRAADAG